MRFASRVLLAAILLLCALPVLPARADVDLCATASCSSQTTTGTISAGSTSLSLGAAKDYQNGQGIRINHAGPATSVRTPVGLGAAPVGATGSTSYLYQIAAFDGRCGISAATSAGGISNGNAILDPDNYVDITYLSSGGATPVGYVVWRSINGGAYQYYKTVNNLEWFDYGVDDAKPDWVPAAPPVADLAQCHQTTIAAGGGGTTVTLAVAATTAVAGEAVAHDDSVALAAAVTALNAAGGGYNLTCPGSARINYLTRPSNITVADAGLVGSPGCTLLPAGDGPAIRFRGPALGAFLALSQEFIEGSIKATLVDTTGLVAGRDYLTLQQMPPAGPGVGFDVAPNFFTSPITMIQGNTVYLNDPTPTVFPAIFSTVTIDGTWAANDTITVSLTGQNPSSVTYKAVAGDTPLTVGRGLSLAINAAYGGNPGTGGKIIAAQFSRRDYNTPAEQVLIFIPSTVATTFTATKSSSGGTVDYNRDDGDTKPLVHAWTPLDGIVGVHNITIDGKNSTGTLIDLSYYADVRLKGLTLKNSHTGGVATLGPGAAIRTSGANYFVLLDDILSIKNGSAAVNFTQPSDIWIDHATVVQESNVRSRGSRGFGPQLQSGSWAMDSNIYQSGASGGRGRKTESFGGVAGANIMSHSSSSTNIAYAYGEHSVTISGLFAYGGERNVSGNGVCVWMDSSGVSLVRLFGVHTAGCRKDDLEIHPADVRNGTVGAVIGGGLSGVYNPGLGRHFYIDGYDRAGGTAGTTLWNGAPIGTQSPTVLFNYSK